MRRHLLSPFLILGLIIAGGVQATGSHHLTCSYGSDYDVQVKASGIAFTRQDGHPADVFMHDGKLRVDGGSVSVSAADAARLRDYEQQVRDLVPEVAAIARDGVEIGYAAMTTVVATLADNDNERTRLLGELHDRHVEAVRQIENTLGQGSWKADDVGDLFGDNVQKTVGDLVGTVTGEVVKDALSGDSTRLAALEARTSALDTTINKAINVPAEKLGQRAEALCPQLGRLEQLQQQFQFRLDGGERLQLISPNKERSDKAGQYAQR